MNRRGTCCVVLLEWGRSWDMPSPLVLGSDGRPTTPTTATEIPVATTTEDVARKEVPVVQIIR